MNQIGLSSILKDKGVRWILFGWTSFITENVVITHNREYLID
jgi:hypothetical protein